MKDIVVKNGVSAIPEASLKNAEAEKLKREEQKLKKACADFESLFVYNLLQTMRKTIPVGNSAMQSIGKETYNMMFDQKIAEEFSQKDGGMGLQAILFNQLRKQDNKSK